MKEYELEIAALRKEIEQLKQELHKPIRRRLDDTRMAVVHKFTVGGTKGYLRVGLFEDGKIGELFINMSKSEDAGTWGCIGILISMALQRGIPLEQITSKLMNTRFGANGVTSNPKIRMATSVMDYIVKWMAQFEGRQT